MDRQAGWMPSEQLNPPSLPSPVRRAALHLVDQERPALGTLAAQFTLQLLLEF